MHSFSVAVLVRKLIELFFILLKVKGLDWIVKSMKNSIKKIINILCKTGKLFKNTENIAPHYFYYVKVVWGGEDLMEEYISFIFSKNYTLLGVELAKKRLLNQNSPM